MAFRATNKVKNAMLDALGALFDTGVIQIYSGSQPATARSAATGTLLAVVTVQAGDFTFGQPGNGLKFDPSVGGGLTKKASQIWQYKGVADGTAGWFRFVVNAGDNGAAADTEAVARIDGRIASAGAEMALSNLSVAVGAVGTIDAFEVDFAQWL